MSGFEVAGVVLGAFPIAITALDKYREVATRLGLFFKIHLEYKKWRDDLEFYQLVLTRHLRQLLLPLIADNDKIEELLSAPGSKSWKDDSMASLLEKRLRDSYQLYFEYIKGIDRVMKDVNRELAVDLDSVQQRLNSPKASSSTAKPKSITSKEKLVFQLYRLKFSNNDAVRKRLFGELQDYNDKLEKLLDSSDKDTRLVQQRTAVGQLASIDAAICNFWVQARNLFNALAAAWSCRCQHHGARLLLQHRTSKKPDFQVMFTAFTSSRWEIHKTRISQGDDMVAATMNENITLLENISLSVSHPGHRQNRPVKSAFRNKHSNNTASATCVELLKAPPSVTLTSVQTTAQISLSQQISNLCASLRLPEGSCCGYLTEDDCRYYVYTISRQSADQLPSVSLDQILRGEVYPPPTRTQRYALSLIMASSFVQLLDSPWLPATSFKKTEVHFLSDAKDANLFLLDQPHINRDFQLDGGSPSEQVFNNAPFTDALDHLGIMLLELCFGRILEDQACRKRWPAGGNGKEKAVFDIMAARDWQCQVNEEAGPDYAEAVGWCLGGNRSTPSERWRQEMLRKVIQPLQRCRDYLTSGELLI
ncbi:hypothetical protein B0H63DRAFT_486905 [Podospora didyma]|uniref:DUF7580 domain-containing protein n=1 Tax=Podospora didyma TaxID=330526 RepID=A0AAE0K5B0_9PEZI|nr:hypothetical protein B0H63DRAFT_486905 [Podospora didyma]